MRQNIFFMSCSGLFYRAINLQKQHSLFKLKFSLEHFFSTWNNSKIFIDSFGVDFKTVNLQNYPIQWHLTRIPKIVFTTTLRQYRPAAQQLPRHCVLKLILSGHFLENKMQQQKPSQVKWMLESSTKPMWTHWHKVAIGLRPPLRSATRSVLNFKETFQWVKQNSQYTFIQSGTNIECKIRSAMR